jgi:hypothetical protein
MGSGISKQSKEDEELWRLYSLSYWNLNIKGLYKKLNTTEKGI